VIWQIFSPYTPKREIDLVKGEIILFFKIKVLEKNGKPLGRVKKFK
jgi:hypothetical protein